MAELMTLAEAARRLGAKPETLKDWIRRHLVPWGHYIPPGPGKINGLWIIKRKSFESWLEN